MDASTDPGWPRLVDAVQRAFAGSPYRVDVGPDAITVIADLADARFLGFASVRRVGVVYRTRLTWTAPARVTWEDAEEVVEWSAGVDGALVPRLTGRIAGMRGRVVQASFRKELGVDERGLGFPVDYAFSSNEIATPLKAAVDQAGFRTAMATTTRIGLVAAVVGGGGAVVAGVVLAVLAATGNLAG